MAAPRKIPATMSTQHPDNAGAAFWCGKSFISTTDEIEEAYIAFKELGCGEYMWDWEGKFVDEAVIDKLFRRYCAYFKKHPLGKEEFLTYRIPNIWEERGYRLARSFINIVTSADLAKELNFHAPPIIEVILPMVKNAKQILHIEKTFRKVARLKCEVFGSKICHFNSIGVIPLIERVEELTDADGTIENYLNSHKKAYGKFPEYLRPFIARSDPALNAGLIPAVLAPKAAISHFNRLAEKYGVPMHPIIGTGSLPFRGGVNPENIKEVIKEYRGIKTITIQSAFKYDYPEKDVKKAIDYINRTLPQLKPDLLAPHEIKQIKELNGIFIEPYQKTVEKLAPFINAFSKNIPSRRERMLHIGLFGYARGVGKVSLPRAITFTAVLYSFGVPPEFIGTGRGLALARQKGLLPLVKRLYVNLIHDLDHAGKYLNKENLELLAKKQPAFKEIVEDVREIEDILGIELGPYKDRHFLHRNLTSTILYKNKMGLPVEHDVVEAAKMRRSLG